jgi:hypothetical protein
VNLVSKVAAFLLLGCLLGLSIPVMPWTMHSSQAAGGCHPSGEMPAPQPSNFHCCQVGHNSAIVQSLHHEELVVFGVVHQDKTSAVELRNSAFLMGLTEGTPVADHPSGGLPLRI